MLIITVLFLGNLSIADSGNPNFIESGNIEDNIGKVLYNHKYNLSFSQDDLIFDKLMGYDTIKIKDCSYLGEIGKPMIPTKKIMIALPNGIEAKEIKVVGTQSMNIEGEYTIFPTQPPQMVDTMDETAFIPPDSQIYNYNKPYPSNLVELNDQTDLAGQGMVAVTIYPIHYVPRKRSLTLITSIEFIIEGVKGYVCGDYLPKNISENGREMYQKMVEEMVINPEDVKLVSSEVPQQLGVDPGDYDYVIITTTSWMNAFQPLADWKTKKGIPANIVTTSWIYNNGGYSGTNQQKIRAFIQDAHSNWGTTFFLLGGDTSYIPYHTAYYQGDNIPTDTYYSDYDDDWICEVHVGRASVYQTGTNAGGIANFINKTLTYEKTPPITNYPKNVALFGFDLDSSTDGEDCKIDIDDLYIPSNWSVTSVYDSHSGNHEDAVDSAVNGGQNLINHIDHSNYNFMGTGWENHWWGLDTSEVDAFNNGDKQSIWYSIGCWACAYDYSNCIAEHFVRDTDGGGVAFVGNSRNGWYYQGNDDSLSLRYDRYFFRSLFDQNHYRLGDLFSDHKMDAYNSMASDDYNKYIFTELTLLGDPEMPIWTENPSSFAVTHPDDLPIGSSSFTVHVENTSGSNVNNANVCLWKGDEIYELGYTGSTGDVTFTVSPSTLGTMYVTVTKRNYIPSESTAQVTDVYEPDDIYTEANWLETDNTKQFHNFHVPGDQDWIKFNATFPYTYVIETSDLGPDSDTVLYLYYTDGTTLIDWDDDGGSELASRIEWTCPINGIYYVMVKHWNNFTSGPETYYNLSIVIEEKSKVCGFVTDSVTGEPIEDADVYLSWHDNQGHYDWNHTYTDSFGFYSMNVAAGEMELEAYADGYFSNDTEWYVIGENETLCVNISLDPHPPENSVVCGYVTDELSGDPIEDAWVDLDWRDDQGHYWNYTYTNSSGFYTMNVAAGEIDLYFSADGYLNNWTDYYTIGENETLWVNISLYPKPPENSVVCGYVNDSVTGTPIEDAWVSLDWQDNQGHYNWNYTHTDSSGFYSMNVAVGEIDLYFNADGYFSEWTDYYMIGENEILWVNMSLYPEPPENSVVYGYVTDSLTGDPIDNAEIKLYWEDALGHYYTNYTYSNISGFYTMNTSSGTIYLRIDADGYYREYTDYYNIDENEILWVNISLYPKPPENSVVCGYVTDELSGEPIEDAEIDLYWRDNQDHYNWNYTHTDSSGFYSMNVATGEIDLYFWADGYFSKWTDYTIENEILWVNMSLYPKPPENSVVCGYVTDEISNEPIEDVEIYISWHDNQGWNYTYTNSSGFYTMNIATGEFDLYFSADGYLNNWTDYYTIGENETLWVNMSLYPEPPENSVVCGYVNDSVTGMPIEDAWVDLDWRDNQGHSNWNYTRTDSLGFYSMNVAAGEIDLYFSADGYLNNWTDYYTIGENETLWVNMSLYPEPPENSVVCGYVNDSVTGMPIEDAWVSLDWQDDQGHSNWNYTHTDSSGFYSMNVAAGKISLYVYADGFFDNSTDFYNISVNETLWINFKLGDNEPPSNVTGLKVNDAKDGKLSLSWNPASDNVGIDYYKIYRDEDFLINTTATSYRDTGLTNGRSYTYQVSAVDTSGNEGNKSDSKSGTPTASDGGGGGGGGTPPPSPPVNTPPVADASAGEPYTGYPDESITFNGSHSYDPDGDIISWYWDFGDGTNGTGETTTHTYSDPGTYDVTLTVTDDDGDTSNCETTVMIIQANRPPSSPIIDGMIQGNKTVEYTYTAVSTDLDNDTIKYFFFWGDGTNTTSGFLESRLIYNTSHSWATSGVYTISVYAEDINHDVSGTSKLMIFIDVGVQFIDDIIKGYLLDNNNDGIYDVFHNNVTGSETNIELRDNIYLIDIDGDGTFDYIYNPATDVISPYQPEPEGESPWIYIATAVIIIILVIIAVIWYIRSKK